MSVAHLCSAFHLSSLKRISALIVGVYFVECEEMSFLPGAMRAAQRDSAGHGSPEVWANVRPWESVKISGSDWASKGQDT